MPIQFPDFQRITYDQANPFLTGMMSGQNIQAKMLANQIAAAKAKYAPQQAQQDLLKSQLFNKYYGPLSESTIGLQGAESGLMGTESALNQFKKANPQYINPDSALMSQSLNQGSGGQSGSAPQSGGSPIQPGTQGPGTQGVGDSSGYAYDKNGNNIVASPQEIDADLNRRNQSQSGGQAAQLASSINSAQQQTQGGGQFSPSQYSSDALAFNPPALTSPTGHPGALDNMYYKKFGMSPIDQAKIDLAKTNAEKYQSENIERNKQFNTESQFANQSTIDAHKFLDALERTKALERGALGGRGPAVTNASQETDAYGNNMAISATKLFQGPNAVHSSDIEINKLAKPGRMQNKDVAFDLAQGVIAKNDRMKERQQFYAQATQLGLKPEIMDAMWNKFETDRPYIDPVSKIPNDAYKGTSRDYLNPEMVNSFLQGKTFIPANQKQLNDANWNSQDLNSITDWAKQKGLNVKGFSKQNLFKLAQKENVPMSQLKSQFRQMGAI